VLIGDLIRKQGGRQEQTALLHAKRRVLAALVPCTTLRAHAQLACVCVRVCVCMLRC